MGVRHIYWRSMPIGSLKRDLKAISLTLFSHWCQQHEGPCFTNFCGILMNKWICEASEDVSGSNHGSCVCDVGWIESDTMHPVNSKNPTVTAHPVNSFGNVQDSIPCVTQIQSQSTTSGSDLVVCDVAGGTDRCGHFSGSHSLWSWMRVVTRRKHFV